jgi:hypothetical protein
MEMVGSDLSEGPHDDPWTVEGEIEIALGVFVLCIEGREGAQEQQAGSCQQTK